MNFTRRHFLRTIPLLALSCTPLFGCNSKSSEKPITQNPDEKKETPQLELEILIGTFLGNETRRYYGRGVPKGLSVLRKYKLGCGDTHAYGKWDTWCGAGWTGQASIARDGGVLYAVIGAFDHNLHKINLATFKNEWKYKFDDIIKGSPSVYIDEKAADENRIVVLQGSRAAVNQVSYPNNVRPSFRAVSFRTGKELWRLNITDTNSYSRDNDSSALDLGNGMLFNAGESGLGYFLSSNAAEASELDGIVQPKVLGTVELYAEGDAARHSGNIVAEASPARIGNMVYIATGAGHIYGVDIQQKKVVWDYVTGSDIDGTSAVSKDNKLFCAIEKQYIAGNGGVLKLDPSKPPEESEDWFLPTANRGLADWEGGVIGSVALNDEYNPDGKPALFAALSIDGTLHIGSQKEVTGKKVQGMQNTKDFDTPKIVYSKSIGGGIASPIFTDGYRLVVANYSGLRLYQISFAPADSTQAGVLQGEDGSYYSVGVKLMQHIMESASFEATPVVHDGKILIACRDGNFYELG